MKNLIIIGASGFGLDWCVLAKESIGYDSEFQVKGFVVHKEEYMHSFDRMKGVEYPILGTIQSYNIQENDVFVCALGDVQTKKQVVEFMISRGANFISLIHKNAIIGIETQIGKGCLIGPHALVGSCAKIGDCCLIQTGAIVAHGDIIGSYSRLDCYVVCVGAANVGNLVTIHTAAVLNHNVVVEDNAVIGANSFVIRRVLNGTTVYGNPAKVL